LKKVLLCDANFSVVPIYKSIKELGNYLVSVVGSKVDDPVHNLADSSISINYSDTNLLFDLISKKYFDYIVPGCNDQAYLSLAVVAEKMGYIGFDHYETVLTIHHKDKFKAFAKKEKYPIAKSIYSLDEASKLNFPILVKPIDSFSGKGINLALNNQELNEFWKEAQKFSKCGAVVAEEFVEGELYSHSAFIKKGKIVVDFFVNEYCTIYPYQVNSSHVNVELSKNIKKGLREWCEQFAKDLNLCDGLIHTQFISDNSSFYLIEVARRSPGDLYSELIYKSTGIDYAKLYSMPFLGLELPDKIEARSDKSFARHTVSVKEDCIFISNGLDIESKYIENIQLKRCGEVIKAAPFDKSGIYFIEFFSKEEMIKNTKLLKDFVKIKSFPITNNRNKNNEQL
jgi:biotin carboxylase